MLCFNKRCVRCSSPPTSTRQETWITNPSVTSLHTESSRKSEETTATCFSCCCLLCVTSANESQLCVFLFYNKRIWLYWTLFISLKDPLLKSTYNYITTWNCFFLKIKYWLHNYSPLTLFHLLYCCYMELRERESY